MLPNTSNCSRYATCAASLALMLCASLSSHAQLNPEPGVDPFTGAFQCSIPLVTVPGPHGSGYTIVMSYTSDVRAEDEASWVGYGWSLEPPKITRHQRGLPDDMRERPILFRTKGGLSSTTVTLFGSGEIIATPKGASDFSASLGAGGSLALTFNSLTGFDVTMSASLQAAIGMSDPPIGLGTGVSYDTKGRFGIGLSAGYGGTPSSTAFGSGISLFMYDPSATIRPTPSLIAPFTGTSITGELSLRIAGYEGGANVSTLSMTMQDRTIYASGFMYSPSAIGPQGNDDIMVDYLVDRERPVTALTASPLPMPLPGYDEFYVSSPSSSGKFRLHHWLPMYARPPQQTSEIDIYSLSLKGILPLQPGPPPPTFGGGIGGTLPIPVRNTTRTGGIASFNDGGIAKETQEWVNRRQPFFRFTNESAEPIRYCPNDGTLFSSSLRTLARWQYQPVNLGQKPRMNRSIEFKTVGEVSDLLSILSPTSKYRDWLSLCLGGFDTESNANGNVPVLPSEAICQFSITAEDGTTTEFGAPEYSLQDAVAYFSANSSNLSGQRNAERIHFPNRQLSYSDFENAAGRDISYVRANQWNATAMYEPNFIDVKGDGPDAGDVGGWTIFKYTNDVERRWRQPHCGYMLDRRMPHDADDDMLAVAEGRYQPHYWRSVETATHIAFFFTNVNPNLSIDEAGDAQNIDDYTYNERLDACEPSDGNAVGQEGVPHTETNTVPYLSRVELWVKGSNGLPKSKLKTIHFSYDYSAFPGNPSSKALTSATTPAGKLTLRRIWSEDRDVRESKIYPIDFYYQYPVLSGTSVDEKDMIEIGSLADRYAAISVPTTLTENPSFDANEVDAWGYQSGVRPSFGSNPNVETQRYAPRQTWDGNLQDPAAWRLKTIRTSTGERIVPVYEARTYQWVQDKEAMTMAKLDPMSKDLSTTTDAGLDWYAVNLNDIGLGSASPERLDEYVKRFTSRFLDGGEPLYYRFGYDVDACEDGDEAYFSRGYAKVTACTSITVGSDRILKFQLGGMGALGSPGSRTFDALLDETKTLPYATILRYWKTFLRGTCDEPVSGNDPIAWVTRFLDVYESLGWKYSNILPIPSSVLPTLNTSVSGVRFPVAGIKTGCGPRVKKLLTISPDGTLEDGDATALGTEYVYGEQGETGTEISSYGVATDEPFLVREENALVGIDPLKWSDASQKVIDEEHMAVSEVPLASMLMPAPSIGYSQVLMRSINRQATTPGYVVQKFLTARELPSITVQAANPAIGPDFYDDPNDLVFRKSELRLGIAQSFSIDALNAHGLPLSVERYSGRDKSDRTLIGALHYDYLPHKGESLEFRDFGSSLRVRTNVDHVDVIQETRQITEDMDLWRLDLSAELVVNPPPVPPGPPLIGGCVLRTQIDHLVQTSALVSISEYQPRLWRTIATVDGRADTTDIVAWDDQTGMPAITMSHDDFNSRRTNASTQSPGTFHTGTVSSVSKPALKIYPDLGQRSLYYRMRFGGESENPGIGKTTATICASGSICINRIPSNVADDECDRGKLLQAALHLGDVIHVSSLAGILQCVVRITAVSMTTCSSAVTLSFEVLHGTTPTTSTPVAIEITAPGTKNTITSNAATQVLYGKDFKLEIERAHDLKKMEDWLWFCNIGARVGSSGRNFKEFEDLNNNRFPFKYDKGGTSIFNPTQTHVSALDDYIGQVPYPNTSCISCNANADNLSEYHYVMQRELDDAMVRLGVMRPRQAYEIQGCECGAFLQYWGLENGATYDCVYHWGWKPGLSLHSDNDCFENSWYRFSSGTTWPTHYAVDEYAWDIWRRFSVGDKGTLVIGSVRPSLLADNSGGMKFVNGNFSSVIPAVAEDAKTLAMTVIPQYKSDFQVDGFNIRQWTPAAVWSWETEETEDASGAAGQTAVTIFNNAGVFDSPSVPAADQAIWTSPLSQEAAPTGVFPRYGWHRTSIIKTINAHSEPTVLSDAKGIHTVLQYSADGLTTEATFVNALSGGSGAAWYENFETGNPTQEVFSGRRSLFVTNSVTVNRPTRVTASGQITGSLLVRAWVRAEDITTMSLAGNLTIGGTAVNADNIIATVNGWNLVEVTCSSSVATGVSVQVQNNLEVWVDDMVVHPVKSISQATVRDDEFRPIAQFGTNHFPLRRAYDAKGRVATVSSDAASGTVASLTSKVNVPGRQRTVDFKKGGAFTDQSGVIPLPMWRTSLDSVSTNVRKGLNRVFDSMKPQGLNASGSLLEIHATPDSVKATSPAQPLLDLMRGVRPNVNKQDSTRKQATEPKK